LFDIAQEKIAIQDAFTRIENLSHSISETEKDRQDALRLIKILDERIAQPELKANKPSIELIFCSLIFAISKSFFAFFISKSFSLLDF
jgi:hypothetical protein